MKKKEGDAVASASDISLLMGNQKLRFVHFQRAQYPRPESSLVRGFGHWKKPT
jgi:hypothetical protein